MNQTQSGYPGMRVDCFNDLFGIRARNHILPPGFPTSMRARGVMIRVTPLLLIVLTGCGVPAEISDEDQAPAEMVLVPGGRFLMGTDPESLPGIMEHFRISRVEMLQPELPQFQVDVEDFFLDRTDVTNRNFHEFVTAAPEWSRERADPSLHNGRYLEHWTPDGPRDADLRRPVTFVTWYAASAYCSWQGKRLPTEAEWEYAAGAGDPERLFPWGSMPPSDDLVTWSGSGRERPDPVASHPPTELGLYDMAGNVWKFLADEWRQSYALPEFERDSTTTGTRKKADTRYAVRGGSYGASAVNMRIQYRDSHRANDAREMVGFRCARSSAAPDGAP